MNLIGLVFRKPTNVPRVIDADAQRAFITLSDKILNSLIPTEMVMFVDGVHPTRQSRAAARLGDQQRTRQDEHPWSD
jgi:hypothetical protein